MLALTKSVDEVKRQIPGEVLRRAFFNTNYNYNYTLYSLDELIISNVIRSRVLIDMNLIGGTEVPVPLEGLVPTNPEPYVYIFNIPKKLTNGRSIIAVLGITYTTHAAATLSNQLNNISSCSATPGMMAANAVYDSFAPIPQISTARVRLIAENTVMVRDANPIVPAGHLRCVLAYDENLNDIQLRAIPIVTKLAVLAVKAYIYNELIVTLNRGELTGGRELGVIKEIVEGYRDAEEMYQETLRKNFAPAAFTQDAESMTRMLKMMVGIGR